MNEIVKADIFFVITTLAVILVTAVVVVVLIYVIKILRDVRYITNRAKEESELIVEDINELRAFLKKEGKKTTQIGQLLTVMIGKFLHRRKRSRRKTQK